MDGGLERLVRILHDFCMCPPPPENPAILYGLTPPNARPPKLVPTLNPQSFDKHAAYRFSLAFQCIVNIGVRGSEPIRSRVVQAGTLDVVGCILEAWLANKGFAVGPSSSATGIPRETREQRMARRMALAEQQRQREEAAELARALQRQIQTERDAELSWSDFPPNNNNVTLSISDASSSTDADTSTDTSTAATPVRSNTPTGAVFVQSRDRSGTLVGRPIWDQQPRRLTSDSPSRPDTETEDDGDGDGDVDMDRARDTDDTSPSPRLSLRRTVVGIVSDAPPQPTIDADAHIIINDARGGGGGGLTGTGGVEDGIVSLEPNDDFAMGAPPGAPGAIGLDDGGEMGPRGMPAPDVTPRAAPANLPLLTPAPGLGRSGTVNANSVGNPRAAQRNRAGDNAAAPTRTTLHHHHHHHHHRESDSGPYRNEDVLLSLQLLAYLSKYPHVRQAFYKPRPTFHPASANLPGPRPGQQPQQGVAGPSRATPNVPGTKDQQHGFFRSLANGRGKEKEKSSSSSSSSSSSTASPSAAPVRHTNVFSLVERFTFRPSSSESNMPNPPPQLPPEIQYWAGVIMRNACRKDEIRGGIRQCANSESARLYLVHNDLTLVFPTVLCGKWETYPREFAKCRRCRKAKYCGKECQSTAWSEGHRFWCSAKDADGDGEGDEAPNSNGAAGEEMADSAETEDTAASGASGASGATATRTERRSHRERHAVASSQAQAQTRDRSVATFANQAGQPSRTALTHVRTSNRSNATPLSRTTQAPPDAPPPNETTLRTAPARQAPFIPNMYERNMTANAPADADVDLDQFSEPISTAMTDQNRTGAPGMGFHLQSRGGNAARARFISLPSTGGDEMTSVVGRGLGENVDMFD
jgi:hypothetical protein